MEYIAEGQAGYFTRAQATRAGVADFELDRGVSYDQIRRLGHGVYRVVGAGFDSHEALRTAWLRVTPTASPIERIYKPTVWVAGRSAATVHGFGDFIADVPEFISTRRLQARMDAAVTVRSAGLGRDEWTVVDGLAVTSAVRTFLDLVAANLDGGHIGNYAEDAIATGVTTLDELQHSSPAGIDVSALILMAAK